MSEFARNFKFQGTTAKLHQFRKIVKCNENLINIVRAIENDDCVNFVGEGGVAIIRLS